MALYLHSQLRHAALRDAVRPSGYPEAARTYVRSESFDNTLLLAPVATGVAAAAVVTANPFLYPVVLVADLWLLGYHHVIATYTRLAFDRQTLRRNRFLAIDLLLLVTAITMTVALTAGAWVIASTFLYLQWFHYMRQSYGISRMYYRATPQGKAMTARDLTADLVIYLVPIYAIAQRSATMGTKFLGLPVKAIVLPEIVITTLGIAAAVAVAAWILKTAQSALRGNLDLAYNGYLLSHIVIFLVGYLIVTDVNSGWLAINVWHNFQYVLVVWMMNTKRFAGGVDPTARFLSRISQPDRTKMYFTCCIAITTIVYFSLNRLTELVLGGGLAISLGIYMGINFHHYIVDALIWKRRRVAAQVT